MRSMVEGANPSAVRGLAPSTAFGGPFPVSRGRIPHPAFQKIVLNKDHAPIIAFPPSRPRGALPEAFESGAASAQARRLSRRGGSRR